MTVDWPQLLRDQDVQFDHGRLTVRDGASTGLKATFEDGSVIPLVDMGVIRVSGADASSFLHTQLTQDIQALDDASWRMAGYCNAKGRLYATFQLLLSDDGFLLLTQRSLVEPLIRRLRMFVLRSKVSLEDVSDEHAAIGIVGRAALPGLDALVGSVPEQRGSVHRAGDVIALALGGTPDRVLVLCSGDDAPGIWETLSRGATIADPNVWALLNIRAGWPEIYSETVESFVPQQVNLELIEGVNFRKGCYPGQEVVARMHYLGKPSRRMYRLTGPDGPVPAPGSKVTTADGSNAGDVVCAAPGPDGLELLAVLRNQYRDRQDLDAGGVKIVVGTLPYEV
ncbi:MAG: hypothetical protein WED00_07465 [Aquisalimonadaceae bacterium]